VPHAIWVRPPTSSPISHPFLPEDAGAAGPRNNDVRCRSARTFGQWVCGCGRRQSAGWERSINSDWASEMRGSESGRSVRPALGPLAYVLRYRKIHVGGEEFEEGRELRPVPVQAAGRPGMVRSETEVRNLLTHAAPAAVHRYGTVPPRQGPQKTQGLHARIVISFAPGLTRLWTTMQVRPTPAPKTVELCGAPV
jgi:hypothetical protein